MPLDESGRWSPPLYPRQIEALAACTPGPQNLVLLNGARWTSKTFACHHIACQHAWNTDRGNICILTITQSVGIDSGVWQHLTEIFLPEWIAGNFGMEWVREPYVQNVTKKPACEVSNIFGNKTRITLESLRNEDEVEERFKGKGYSMIWVNELSKFKKRKTFDTLKQSLRMPHLRDEDHLFLADTNPDLELGAGSWIYQLWYETRVATDEVLAKMYPGVEPSVLHPLQRALRLIEFTIDDNLWLSPEKKAKLKADFSVNPELLQAYYYGKWVTASTDALFYQVFRPLYHVIGDMESASNPEPEILVPQEGCSELQTGQDPGVTNYAAVIGEICMDDRDGKEVPVVKCLDEQVIIGRDFDLNEFVWDFGQKMVWWEKLIGREGKVAWRHWSDRSAFDMKVPFSERFWHQHIYQASGGLITLMAAERGKESVQARVDLLRKLLYDDRFFVCKSKCPAVIEMLGSIRKGKGTKAIATGSPFKHVFDALTYWIASELQDEIARSVLRMLKREQNESLMVSIPM